MTLRFMRTLGASRRGLCPQTPYDPSIRRNTIRSRCPDVRVPLRLEVATIALVALSGCGEPSATLDASAMLDAPAGDTSAPQPDAVGGPTVQMTGTVVSLDMAPIAGVTVIDSLHPTAGATTTDASGAFVLSVPAGERIQLEASRAGSLTTLVPIPPLSTDFAIDFVFNLTRDELNATLEPPIEGLVEGQAVIGLAGFVSGVPRADVTFTSDEAEVRDIVYDDGTSSYAPGSATVEIGDALALTRADPPSVIEVRATSVRGRVCAAPEGWQGASSDTFAVPTRADALTLTLFECEPAEGTRLVSGGLAEYIPGAPIGTGVALDGASVCLYGTSECTRTSRNGDYSIDVPNDVDIALTYEHPGHESILTVLRAAPSDIARFHGLPVAGYIAEMATTFGATHDSSRGVIEFFTSPDVAVTLTGSTGDGPHYLDPTSAPDPALTATSSRGWGFFFGVPEADSVSLRFDHPERPCTTMGDSAWPSPEPETVRVPVAPGHITFVNLRCP